MDHLEKLGSMAALDHGYAIGLGRNYAVGVSRYDHIDILEVLLQKSIEFSVAIVLVAKHAHVHQKDDDLDLVSELVAIFLNGGLKVHECLIEVISRGLGRVEGGKSDNPNINIFDRENVIRLSVGKLGF